jgi:hypothetical protein
MVGFTIASISPSGAQTLILVLVGTRTHFPHPHPTADTIPTYVMVLHQRPPPTLQLSFRTSKIWCWVSLIPTSLELCCLVPKCKSVEGSVSLCVFKGHYNGGQLSTLACVFGWCACPSQCVTAFPGSLDQWEKKELATSVTLVSTALFVPWICAYSLCMCHCITAVCVCVCVCACVCV